MHLHFGRPPRLWTGEPLEYCKQRCSEFHDSYFPGNELFIGRGMLGDSLRAIQLILEQNKAKATVISVTVTQQDSLEEISLNLLSHRIKEELRDKGYQSSIFSDVLIFYENFVVLYWDDDGIDTIEWWDPEYWDQASFIEATYP